MRARDATAGSHVAQRGTTAVAQRRRGEGGSKGALGGVVAIVVVAVGALGPGCRSGSGVSPLDAGAPCLAATKCDGTAVRVCRNGRAAEVIQECAPEAACSLGRCTTPACAEAEADLASVLGCTFYTFDLDNVDSDDLLGTSVLVTNPGQRLAHVVLERRAGGDWTVATTVEVAPMRSARIVLSDSHLEGGGLSVSGALRLTSDVAVSVAHVQSDGGDEHGASSSGATLLLPAHVLGRRYRAASYRQTSTPKIDVTLGARGGAGQIVIVGTADRTNVTVTASKEARFVAEPDGPSTGPGETRELVLDEGDVAQLYGVPGEDSLMGTEIKADHPVAVFSGNISTTYGSSATGINSPDLAHEQLVPVRSWGTSFVGPIVPPQPGVCDPVLAHGRSMLLVVADKEGTDVRVASIIDDVDNPLRQYALAPGERIEVQTPHAVVVTSSHPVQVMQGIDCEPTLSSAVPTAPLLKDFYFAVLPGFDTVIALVRRPGRAVFLDGARLEESLFEPVGGGFDVAHVPLEACPRAEGVCTHHVEGEFGLTMRGMDVLASWALTVPTWVPVPCGDPDLPDCL